MPNLADLASLGGTRRWPPRGVSLEEVFFPLPFCVHCENCSLAESEVTPLEEEKTVSLVQTHTVRIPRAKCIQFHGGVFRHRRFIRPRTQGLTRILQSHIRVPIHILEIGTCAPPKEDRKRGGGGTNSGARAAQSHSVGRGWPPVSKTYLVTAERRAAQGPSAANTCISNSFKEPYSLSWKGEGAARSTDRSQLWLSV